MSELWKELHMNAISYTGTNNSEFLINFGKKIPRFTTGCSCHEFWRNWTRLNLPTYGPGEYFEWTVRAHNAVNLKLGKPYVSVEDAIKLYTVE